MVTRLMAENRKACPTLLSSIDAGARLMLVVLSVAWGVTWPANRIALEQVPPFSMRVATFGGNSSHLLAAQ